MISKKRPKLIETDYGLEDYINSNVSYVDGELISSNGWSIMSKCEDKIMKESAKVLCQNGGSVLNVGFGMGIIDSYIRDLNPSKHTIVEIHPDVVKKAKEMGFEENIRHIDWVDFVDECILNGIKFDAVYFDTYSFDDPEWNLFTMLGIDSILNEGGIYCYFNAGAAKSQNVYQLMAMKGWQPHAIEIPKEEINDSSIDENHRLYQKEDYDLIWYIKT